MKKTDLIVILGCTATGKTAIATHLAYALGGEVISADSRQVYRGMDVGTGKDLKDYVIGGQQIPYHLIDIKDAGEEYNVFEYQKDFLDVFKSITSRGVQPILCGGTGLYIESVIKGYRFIQVPENKVLRKELESKPTEELVGILSSLKALHNTTDTVHRKRTVRAIEVAQFEKENEALIRDFPAINYTIFGVDLERSVIRDRITNRLKHRIEKEGMIEEVQRLLNEGVSAERLKFYGLEYKLITQHLQGEMDRATLFNTLNIAIHQFAKRQATWFRKMERNGFEIQWLDGTKPIEEKVNFILEHIK